MVSISSDKVANWDVLQSDRIGGFSSNHTRVHHGCVLVLLVYSNKYFINLS